MHRPGTIPPTLAHLVALAAGDDTDQQIEDLLVLSHVARVTLRLETVSMGRIVTETVHRLEREMQNRCIRWRLPPLPEVVGDATLLRQALANLLGNALTFTCDRNPAKIEVGCAGCEAGRVIFFVRDNGTGFEPQFADGLPDVFHRPQRPGEIKGTGIGPALVRRIIARHGGRTWAEGTANGGAAIYFTLVPASVPLPRLGNQASVAPPAGARGHAPARTHSPAGLRDRRGAYPGSHHNPPGAGPA